MFVCEGELLHFLLAGHESVAVVCILTSIRSSQVHVSRLRVYVRENKNAEEPEEKV